MKKHTKNINDRQLFNYLNHTASKEEIQRVENWIKTDPKNEVYFIRFKQVFDTADSYALYDSIHVENRWKAFKQLSENRPVKGKVIQLSTKWMKIAASVFLFLSLGVSSYYFYSQSQYITYEYSALHSSVSLPDSSVVYLEPGAKLSFNKDFNRKVSFEGEAFFDVKSNPDQVFMVDLHNSEIKVLGTSFNVKTGTLVEVKLYEGKLSFQSKFDSVIMKSGDRVKYDPGKEKVIRKQFADTTTFFEFKNEKLKNVFKVLEQRYLYKIDFSPDIADYQISGRFMLDTDITEILELLSTIIDIRYTIKKRHISIEVKTENNKNRNKNSLNHVESG